MVSDIGQDTTRQKVRILAAAKAAQRTQRIKEDSPCSLRVRSMIQQAGNCWPLLRNARRNRFGDPKYHSGRKKKEFASPYLEFLDKLEKLARKMPQPYEFDPLHAAGIRHADLDAGGRVLNKLIFECQRSLEGIVTCPPSTGTTPRERIWGVTSKGGNQCREESREESREERKSRLSRSSPMLREADARTAEGADAARVGRDDAPLLRRYRRSSAAYAAWAAYERATAPAFFGGFPNSSPNSDQSEPPTASRSSARKSKRRQGVIPSEAAGTRTQDQRIKSPMLYRLSYSLGDNRTEANGGSNGITAWSPAGAEESARERT